MTIPQDDWETDEMPVEKNPEMSFGHSGNSWVDPGSYGVERNYGKSMLKHREDYRCINNNNNTKYNTLVIDKRSKRYQSPMGDHLMNGYEPNGNLDYGEEYRPRASSFDADKHFSNSHLSNGDTGYNESAMRARQHFRQAKSRTFQYDDSPSGYVYNNNPDSSRSSHTTSGHAYGQPEEMTMSYNGHVVHDGYATITRSRKNKPVRASHHTGLARVNDSITNPSPSQTPPQRTVVFPQEPLSMSFDAKILRMLQAQQQNGHVETTAATAANTQAAIQKPTKFNLAHTVHALPQHDIQVHHARSVYLTKKSISESSEYPREKQAPYTNDLDHVFQSKSPSTPDSSSIDSPTKSKSPLFSLMSARFGSLRRPKKAPMDSSSEEIPKFKRSNSTPNIMDNLEISEDEDNDDYGFLSFRSFRSKDNPFKGSDSPSTDMQKVKAGHQNRGQVQGQSGILPKKWRKSKPSQNKTSQWKPQGGYLWSSASGKKVVLSPTHLLNLTEMERLCLRKIAHTKLQNMDLGCPIVVPKDHGNKRSKRGFSLKKRNLSGSLLDGFKDKTKERESKDSGTSKVFGVPLTKVIANDLECERRRLCLLQRRDSADVMDNRPRNSSTSSAGNISSDSLSETDSRSTGSTLLDALSLSSSGRFDSQRLDHDPRLATHMPHVPYVVDTCFKHIETHGVQVTGIFRIGSSKKRVKQLREEFDSGQEVGLNDDHSPHDVGGLLKEFLRDLPDPLLSRDLYSAFVATTKLKDECVRTQVLRLLVSLLPVANRDTLYALLKFLNVIVQHSSDVIDCNGQQIPGNKMDSNNLATLFGPNLLHKAKGREFEVDSIERLDERGDVITVVKSLIDNYIQIFELPAQLHDEVFKALLESNPDALDVLLRRKLQSSGVEHEVESSSSHCDDVDSAPAVTSPVSVPQAVVDKKSTYENVLRQKQYHNVQVHDTARPQNGVKMRERLHSAVEKPTQSKEVKSNYRMSTPEPSRYKSPPLAHGRTSVAPDLHIRVTPESLSDIRPSSSSRSGHTPRVARKQEQIQNSYGGNLLTVPPFRDSKERASNSSLSSGYYGSSSRSGTTSPTTLDAPHKWYMDTPPDSPPPVRGRTKQTTDYAKEASPAPFQRTSSLQRPLGFAPIINISNSVCPTSKQSLTQGYSDYQGFRSPSLPQWQKERWRHWEQVAKKRGDELQEQETLV